MKNTEKDVVVLVGSGSIGQAIARRVGSGKHIVLADINLENSQIAAKTLENAGFKTSTIIVDISEEESEKLATLPTEELLNLDFLKNMTNTLKAYQYSKRCNNLRVMYEATKWGERNATINSISPGIIITPLANDELNGPRGEGYRKMLDLCPARRAGTPDEVGELAEFLVSHRGRFMTGSDYLIDGGTTASYWYGNLQYLKETH